MYEFPPFRLDAVNQCLWSHVLAGEDERIQLTPKAFAILQHLVNNANRLVPHRELIDVAWPDTFVQPEVLSSHIRDLRAALGDNAREPRFIETLARRGYRFIAKVIESVPRASDNPPDFAPRKLVGRELPLAKLNERFKAMLGGRRQLVFITGEPGIGKTALCLQFLHQIQASAQPYHIGWGQCIEGYGGQEPYFPMLRAIGELCRTGGDSVLRTLTLKAPTCVVQFPGLLKPEHREMLERAVIGATAGRMLALGNYDQAFKELLTLREDMDRKAFMLDWYFRMPLESALTELWLAIGSLTKAREGVNLFLGKAMSTMERTWRALAWELNARVALAERNLGGAQEAILKALSVIEGRETPLAAWRVHAAAAHFYEFSENPKLRQHHREIARTIVLKLANSFGAEHSLRTSFLSSPSASGLLEEKDTIYTG